MAYLDVLSREFQNNNKVIKFYPQQIWFFLQRMKRAPPANGYKSVEVQTSQQQTPDFLVTGAKFSWRKIRAFDLNSTRTTSQVLKNVQRPQVCQNPGY